MGKNGYTKPELETLVYTQLENLNALGEQIQLLKEQNLLLTKLNNKLISLVSDNYKEPKPYPPTPRKKRKQSDEIFLLHFDK